MGERINFSEVSAALISVFVIYTTYIIEWNAPVVKDVCQHQKHRQPIKLFYQIDPGSNPSRYLGGVVLQLLNIELLTAVLSVVSSVPEDLLDLVVAVAVNGEPSLAAVGEQTLLVDTKSSGIAALRDSAGVRQGQAEGRDRVLDNVEVLESGGNTVLGSV